MRLINREIVKTDVSKVAFVSAFFFEFDSSIHYDYQSDN
jgi:hypothetical protein